MQKEEDNSSLESFPKLEKDGEVAVLYSPGFGAGWLTWNNNEWKSILTTHRDIVRAVLDGKKEKAGRVAEEIIRKATGEPEPYVCVLGKRDLTVKWLPKGTVFEIEEYDGSETIHIIGSRNYQVA